MPITSIELRDFAEALAVEGSDETALRASISRSYYACFHALMPLVSLLPESKKFRGSVNITHEDFAERLSEWRTESIHPKLEDEKAVAGQLVRAIDVSRVLRHKADYKLSSRISLGEARQQVERARRIHRAVEHLDRVMASQETAPDVA